MLSRFTKRADDYFVAAVDFTTWPLNTGESVAASNSRGALAVTVTDGAGADVTAALTDGAPWVVGTTLVAFWLRAGTPVNAYSVVVKAPTSDNEILTHKALLEVLP